MITNERTPGTEYGLRDEYENMQRHGEIGVFRALSPAATAANAGAEAAARELYDAAAELHPNVVLVLSPSGLGHEPEWVQRYLESLGGPFVAYWEGDPWHRWGKPVTRSMRAWLAAADVVFSVAREPQFELLRRSGASDVRFIPHTYCHVQFADVEDRNPLDDAAVVHDAVLIGSRLAHFGLVSRVPGAAARASLVRRLQRRRDLRLAVYGSGWHGRGVRAPVPYNMQVRVIREGLMSVNWDHFPRHASYASDRLPISLLAGRVHITTSHPGLDWLPGREGGLFLEPSVAAVVERVEELTAMPSPELLELGAAGYEWVRRRLSDREAARFMLGAVQHRFLEDLPADPWRRFAAEWPNRDAAVDASPLT
jgi:hypothetical protein